MRQGFQGQWDDPRLRKNAANGPPGYRRRYSAVARQVALTIDVPRLGKGVFDQFFEETTAMGSLPFNMPDPTTDGWPLLTSGGVPVLTGGGLPILLARQWVCLFGAEPPVETIQGVRFRIAFSVSVMP